MPARDPAFLEKLRRIRRDLHRHPELSHQEQATAARVASELEALGLQARGGVAGHGVVAEIPGREAGPVVALRADLDALPIQEETGLPFASERAGVMHACGHDGHTALLLGAAELLCEEPPPLPVRLIFQPAEETAEGARAMLEAGVLENVAMIFGGHLDRRYATGSLIVTEGPVNASTDRLRVEIRGRSGHGGRPHETTDAVVVGSLLVTALQSVVSREVDPASPAVVSLGVFQAGSAHNVIAGQATLEGTVRAQRAEVREQIERAIRRIAGGVGEVYGAQVEVSFRRGAPPLINSPEMTALARQAATRVVGEGQVRELARANMGGEDFAFFLEQARGCYIRFGAAIGEGEGPPAHSSRFDFDEAALPIAAEYLATAARIAGERLAQGG